jgi:hypothetical protein
LKKKIGSSKLTNKLNDNIKIDFKSSLLEFKGKQYSFNPVGEAAQELLVLDGLENWIKKNIN